MRFLFIRLSSLFTYDIAVPSFLLYKQQYISKVVIQMFLKDSKVSIDPTSIHILNMHRT